MAFKILQGHSVEGLFITKGFCSVNSQFLCHMNVLLKYLLEPRALFD